MLRSNRASASVAHRLGHGRVAEQDEVVAPDVAGEARLTRVQRERLDEHARGQLDHLVAAEEAVEVVERLELVEVGVEHREARVGLRHQPFELARDPEVAGKMREG